jgi:response regulator RpfG family c-di-GMP phosphodiesterase
MTALRALVVDDEEGMRSLVTDFLRDEGFDVEAKASIAEATDSLQRKSYDLMLADLKITDGSGLDLVRHARTARPEMVTIIMTGYGTVENARMAIKEGAYDFVLKPFDLDELRMSVNNALERKRLAEENARLRELAGLFETSKALSALLEESKLPHLVLGSALAQLKAARGYILISDPWDPAFHMASAVGWSDELIARARKSAQSDLLKWVNESGEPVLVTSDPQHPLREKIRCYLASSCQLPLPLELNDSMISIPLRTHKNVIGILNVVRDGAQPRFSEADMQLLTILSQQSAVAIVNSRLMANAQDAYLSTFTSLVRLIEARDPYTHGHSRRVTHICEVLAKDLGLHRERIQPLKYAASLHDIGKVGISEAILNKPYQLEESEWRDIRRHPEIGYNVLEPIRFLAEPRTIILHHHERCDGSGYPSGLRAPELTDQDHILIVADIFDAMNSDRAYRKRLPAAVIVSTLEKQKGGALNADTVDALLRGSLNGGFEEAQA